jgi:hypothetical protein
MNENLHCDAIFKQETLKKLIIRCRTGTKEWWIDESRINSRESSRWFKSVEEQNAVAEKTIDESKDLFKCQKRVQKWMGLRKK